MGLLQAYTNAVGRQLELIAGVPATRLTRTLTRTSTVAEVETTLAFPDEGAFFCEGIRFTYTGKTNDTFTGVTSSVQFLVAKPAGTLLNLDITTAPPE